MEIYFLLYSTILISILGLIIFGIYRLFRRGRKNTGLDINETDWYLHFAFSKEDAVSQFFILISTLFLGITLLSLNKNLQDILSWQTILLITSLIGIIIAYYQKAIYTLAISLIGFASWWMAQNSAWALVSQNNKFKYSNLLAGLLLIGILLYIIGHIHGKNLKFKRFSLVYLIIGLVSISGILFYLSTKLGLKTLEYSSKGMFLSGSIGIAIFLIIFLVSSITTLIYSLNKKIISGYETAAIIILIIIAISIAIAPEQKLFASHYSISSDSYATELSNSGIIWAIIFNIAAFLELLGIIFTGYIRKERWFINLGALFLFIFIIAKYFDWFFTFLDKSLFFLIAGALLLFVGYFMEKGRRYMVSNIKNEKA